MRTEPGTYATRSTTTAESGAYHDVALNPHVQNAYHAVSIDERRKPFQPNLWSRPPGWQGALEQAWFPGVHCGVGGGYSPDGLANEALHWIVEKAEGAGLAINSVYLEHFSPVYRSTLFESMSAKYRIFGEYVRPIGVQPNGNERVHQAALDRRGDASCNYSPSNLETFLQNHQSPPISDTRRISRGPKPSTTGKQ